MATAKKHMLRSHRNYGKNVDFSMCERKAIIKKAKKEQDGLLARIARIFGGK